MLPKSGTHELVHLLYFQLDSNQNHLIRKRTKWFCVRVQLQSLKLQISRLLRATIDCGFTLKRVSAMTRTYGYISTLFMDENIT